MGSKTSGSFKPGDKRINRKGRPKSFDALRALAQEIAHEVIADSAGNQMTVTEDILKKWASSKDPRLQVQFIDVAYGKVPNITELKGELDVKTQVSIYLPDNGRN